MLIPRAVFALSKLCDGESSRYALGGVLFERIDAERCRAVVTDGRCLVIVEWRENHAFDTEFGNFPLNTAPGFVVLIPAGSCVALQRLGKPTPKTKMPPKCEVVAIGEQAQESQSEFRACVLTENGRLGYSAVTCEGRFPRWQDVVYGRRKLRAGTAMGAVSLDTELFSRVLVAVNEVSRDETGTACGVFTPPSNDEPVIIAKQCDNGLRVFAMLMPKVAMTASEETTLAESQLWWPDISTPKPAPVEKAPSNEPATIVGQWREVVTSAAGVTYQANTLEAIQ
jgi:hypothetical protein